MSIYTITTQPAKLVITSSNMVTENVHPSSHTISKTARVAFDHLWSCVWVGLLWPRPSQVVDPSTVSPHALEQMFGLIE